MVITARDHRGRPVPRAAISLGVVDEAVYQTREDPLPDLFALLYEYEIADPCRGRQEEIDPARKRCSSSADRATPGDTMPVRWSAARGIGNVCLRVEEARRHSERWPGIALRRRFETAAHWVADVFTDADGTARVSFKLPDNVTQWRFTARGVTADTLVGSIVVARRTFLPLNVELALPRGFHEGDRIDLPVVVHNNTNHAQSVQGTTQIAALLTSTSGTGAGGEGTLLPSPVPGRGAGGEGVLLPSPWPERLLPAAATLPLPFRSPPTTAGRWSYWPRSSRGRCGRCRAAATRSLAAESARDAAWSGLLNAATVPAECVQPRAERATALSLSVRRESGLAGPVQSALNELVQYPYGCVEQTMSRFMPAVVAGAAMQEAGLKNPAGERLPAVIGQGLQRLADFQHADGGWGWWNFDETNDFMTAYVIEGLARCRRVNQPVRVRRSRARLGLSLAAGRARAFARASAGEHRRGGPGGLRGPRPCRTCRGG